MSLESIGSTSNEQLELNQFEKRINDMYADINEAYCAIGISNIENSIDSPPSSATHSKERFESFDLAKMRAEFTALFSQWLNFRASDGAVRLSENLDTSATLNTLGRLFERANMELHKISEAKGEPKTSREAA